jgi:GntR family transcriptional regulator, glc operon transcriptional activator
MKTPTRASQPTPERRQLADIVAERIERLITDGVLKVGQALPSERRLCEKLGCSRSALREGLRVLRGLGVIETRHGQGSFVARLSAARDVSPLMHLFSSQPRTLYDLLEVRALLESEAARLAALRGTTADFIMIRRRYEELVARQGHESETPAEEHARLDHDFHRAISEASHNPVLVHTLQSLSDLMLSSVFASVNNLYHRPAHKAVIDRQHQRLYQAVIERQPDKAGLIAREHINRVCEGFAEIEQEEQRLVRATMRLEGWR